MTTRPSVCPRLLILWIVLLITASAWAQPPIHIPATPLRIALISDLHITSGTRDEQVFHHGRLQRTIAAVNAEGVDLVLVAGDLTENGSRRELRDVSRQVRALKAPVWFVPGNHDVGGKVIPGKTAENAVAAERIKAYERQMGPSWFVREQAGVRVIGINTSLLGSGLPQEAEMWKRLEAALVPPSPNATLLLLHYPLFSKRPDEAGGVYWNVEPGPRKRLLDLIRQSGAKAVLSGHLHTENQQRLEGVLYVTTPPVAFGLPKGRQYRGWTLLTVAPNGEVQSEFRYQVD